MSPGMSPQIRVASFAAIVPSGQVTGPAAAVAADSRKRKAGNLLHDIIMVSVGAVAVAGQ